MKANRNCNYLKHIVLLTISTFLLLGCASSQPELEMGTVVDIDGNEYKTVKIGDQWWMAENLRVTNYQDGTPIPKVTDGKEWTELTTGAYCAYENDYENVIPYGFLYNWYAVTNESNICPEDWHVPSDGEWKELEMYLGMSPEEVDKIGSRGTDIGGMLKEAGTEHWEEPNTDATNETGLSIISNGGRPGDSAYMGTFYYKGSRAPVWSSSEQDENMGLHCRFLNNKSEIDRVTHGKGHGFSVRCIQD